MDAADLDPAARGLRVLIGPLAHKLILGAPLGALVAAPEDSMNSSSMGQRATGPDEGVAGEVPSSGATPFFDASGSSSESDVLRKYFLEISALWMKNEAIFFYIWCSVRLLSIRLNSYYLAII